MADKGKKPVPLAGSVFIAVGKVGKKPSFTAGCILKKQLKRPPSLSQSGISVKTKRYPNGLPGNFIQAELKRMDIFLEKKYPENPDRKLKFYQDMLVTFPDSYKAILAPYNLWKPYQHLCYIILLDELLKRQLALL